MLLRLKYLIFFILVFPALSFAKQLSYNQISLKMGMLNHSFSQQESAFPDTVTQSGSSSIILMNFQYDHFFEVNRSAFANVVFSGVGGEVEKTYGFTSGVKYFFDKFGTKSSIIDNSLEFDVEPQISFFAGWEFGVLNHVYQANTEVRSDLAVAFGGVLGGTYANDSKSNFLGEIHVLKGTGVETSYIDVSILFGINFYIEPFF